MSNASSLDFDRFKEKAQALLPKSPGVYSKPHYYGQQFNPHDVGMESIDVSDCRFNSSTVKGIGSYRQERGNSLQ